MDNRFNAVVDHGLAWLVATFLGGVYWLVRRVFTNQRQIELLQADLEFRARQRLEDRDRIIRIEGSIERIENRLINRPD